jgi:hypothetical protein
MKNVIFTLFEYFDLMLEFVDSTHRHNGKFLKDIKVHKVTKVF